MTAIQWRGPSLLRFRNPPQSAFRGLGQDDSTSGDSTVSFNIPGVTVPSTTTPSAGSGGGTSSSTGTGINWGTIISNAISTAGKTAQVALSPLSALQKGTTVYQTPSGTYVSTGGSTTGMNLLTSAQLSNYMPIILIGGAVLVFAMVMGGARK